MAALLVASTSNKCPVCERELSEQYVEVFPATGEANVRGWPLFESRGDVYHEIFCRACGWGSRGASNTDTGDA